MKNRKNSITEDFENDYRARLIYHTIKIHPNGITPTRLKIETKYPHATIYRYLKKLKKLLDPKGNGKWKKYFAKKKGQVKFKTDIVCFERAYNFKISKEMTNLLYVKKFHNFSKEEKQIELWFGNSQTEINPKKQKVYLNEVLVSRKSRSGVRFPVSLPANIDSEVKAGFTFRSNTYPIHVVRLTNKIIIKLHFDSKPHELPQLVKKFNGINTELKFGKGTEIYYYYEAEEEILPTTIYEISWKI